MKVLFVSSFDGPEYMSDAVYHGLAVSDGVELYETSNPSYMLSSYQDTKKLYGKGFTIFGKLDRIPNIEEESLIIDKIKSRFYDRIVYGRIYPRPWANYRTNGIAEMKYFSIVVRNYSKTEIHIIDGGDDPEDWAKYYGVKEYATVWKTHLLHPSIANPISFAIPESQLIKEKVSKEKMFSYITPSDTKTYIYENEEDYYKDYATSYYGVSFRKSQWETMRSLEIFSNRCIPYYSGLQQCPQLCLTNFPKRIILETNIYAAKNKIHPEYEYLSDYLFEYTKQNLLTKHLTNLFL